MSSLATDGINTLNKANDIYIAATEATKILTDVAEQFPVIGAVAKLLKNIYERAEKAKKSKETCQRAAKRCRALEIIIAQCAQEYRRQGKTTKEQGVGLNLLKDALSEMSKLVSKYATRGSVSRFFQGNNFNEEYNDINTRIDNALQIVQVSRMNEMHAKFDLLGGIHKGKDRMKRALDENEIDPNDITRGFKAYNLVHE